MLENTTQINKAVINSKYMVKTDANKAVKNPIDNVNYGRDTVVLSDKQNNSADNNNDKNSKKRFIIAVSAERFGRNPLEFSLNFASHIGSMTCKIHCCTIRSTIVGIPRGLVFPLGFGISTRLTGRG